MSKYTEQNIDSASNGILKYVFSPLIFIAIIAGLSVWGVNASKEARIDGMERACTEAFFYHHKAFVSNKNFPYEPVYIVNREDVSFVGDSKRHFRGTGFVYEFSISRAKDREGNYVYGTAYVSVKLRRDGWFHYRVARSYLEDFAVHGDAE